MTEPEFASVIENDGKVEKAEAYGKELENVGKTHQRKKDSLKIILCY